jgi:hypothetical protein
MRDNSAADELYSSDFVAANRNIGKQVAKWTPEDIEEIKVQVKAELDHPDFIDNPRNRLRYCLAAIRRVHDDDSIAGRFRLFILAVSALLHHARNGGLTRPQVNQMMEMAHGILKLLQVPPVRGRLSFLYGYIHTALSQIYWQEGKHWHSSWEQYLALRVVTVRQQKKEGFHYLIMSNRLARLGDLRFAMHGYEVAERLGLNDASLCRARLMRVRCLRILGDYDSAATLAAESLTLPAFSGEFAREMQWEGHCREAQQTLNLNGLMRQTRLKAPFYDLSYILDLTLWMYAVPSVQWLGKSPNLSTMKRKFRNYPPSLDRIVQIIETIHDAYDQNFSFDFRIEQIGQCLQIIPQVSSIEHELICWLAIARALFRMRLRDQALTAMCLSQYESLCLRITRGQSHDVFKSAGDMLSASWYRGPVFPD